MVRLRAEILRADRATADRWYVTNGATAVGPVALELVERGVEAGKIPVDSYIRHETWKIWRPLSELCILEEIAPIDALATPVLPIPIPLPAESSAGGFDPRETTMKPAMSAPQPDPALGPSSARQPMSTQHPLSARQPMSTQHPLSARQPMSTQHPLSAAQPQVQPPGAAQPLSARQPMSGRQQTLTSEHTAQSPVSTTVPPILSLDDAEEIDPDPDSDDIEDARPTPPPGLPPPAPSVEDITLPGRLPKAAERVTGDPLSGAALLKDALLTLSSVILRDVGCEGVMVHRVDDEGAVAVVAHGPRMFDVIGLRTRLLDPAIVAAAAGILVVAEPSPGPAGRSVLDRLEKLGVSGTGAVMIPIRPNGRLFGTVEMGQSSAFNGASIAKAEGFVQVVQAKLEATDWKLGR